MQDDAQYDGAEHGGDDGALAEEGRLILQHHHRKDDAGQPPRPEPADEELEFKLEAGAEQAQPDRHHAQQGEAGSGIEPVLPVQQLCQHGHQGGAEHHPDHHREQIPVTFAAVQVGVLVLPQFAAHQQAADEGGDEAAAPQGLGQREAEQG